MDDRLSRDPGTRHLPPPDSWRARLGRVVRSRTLRLLVTLALAVGLVALTATEVAWSRTRPLTHGSTQIGVRICPDPARDEGCELRTPKPGEAFIFGFTMRNRRSLPLTLLGATFGKSNFVAIENLRMTPADLQDPGNSISATVPFEPFVLQEGEERTLYAQARISDCMAANAEGFGFSVGYVTVSFRSLLATQTQVIRLQGFLRHQLKFPYTLGACP
jgi:hypothetical protein